MAIIFKIKYGDDTRRISLARAPSFDELTQIAKQLFNIKVAFVLKYEDEEKDQITIASQEELNEALEISKVHFAGIVRLTVTEKDKVESQSANADALATVFTTAVSGGALDISKLLGSLQALGHNPQHVVVQPNQANQSLQLLSQLLTAFPWLNDTITNVLKQGLQYPPPAAGSSTSNSHEKPSPPHKLRYMAKFIKDVSIMDGTVFAPETKFVKTWRLRNDGQTAWPEQTYLAYVGGDQLGTSAAVPVPPVAAGQEVEISVPMLAPSLAGRYNSFWRLCGPDGSKFGHRMWVDITVKPAPQEVPVAPIEQAPEQQPQLVEQVAEQIPQLVDVSIEPQHVAPQYIEPLPIEPQPIVPVAQSQDAQVENNNNVPSEKSTTSAEADALVTLVDMGFKGDLLATLRKNGGDLMRTLAELVSENN